MFWLQFLEMSSLYEDPNAEISPPNVDKDERKETQYVIASLKNLLILVPSKPSSQNPSTRVQPNVCDGHKSEDKVLVLSFALLYKEIVDAVHEGDGLKVLSWWHLMMLIFKSTGRVNYSIEAFTLHKFLLSEREKTQLLYSRFVNMHSLPGKNISCDLYMEHLNHLLKYSLGANKTPKAIDQLGKCITPLGEVLDTYDRVNGFESQTSHHNPPGVDKDMTILVKGLLKANVFDTRPGHKHHAFSSFTNNPVSSLAEDDVNKWMQIQWTKLKAGLL